MSQLAHIRWLFFDLGNTLINEKWAIQHRIQLMCQGFAELGIDVSAEAIREAFEDTSAEFAPRLVAKAVQRFISDPADCAFVLERATYPRELEEPYPDAVELLSRLASHFRIGVIANQSSGTQVRMERYGLATHVSICLASAEVGSEKPDPAIFHLALKEAECKPSQAVMIGDRLDNDIHPAKSLGWKTIRVLQGFGKVQSPRTSEEEPDYTVASLAEVEALLLQ